MTIAASVYFARNGCFCGDDFNFANYYNNEKIFDCLFGSSRFQHGGYYIGLFLCKFLSFGFPNMIGIHPSDFIGVGEGVIKGIFLFINIFILSFFADFFGKERVLTVFCILFSASYYFYNALGSQVLTVNYSFYRYVFSLIFFGIFIFYVSKNCLVSLKKTNIFALIGVSLCAFILGTSVEMLSSIALIFVCGLILYNAVLFAYSKFKADGLIFSKNCLYFSKKIYIPFGLLIAAMVLFYSNMGTQQVISTRTLTNIEVSLSSVGEFLSLFREVCIIDVFPVICVICLFFVVSLHFAIKKSEPKKVLVSYVLLFSIFAFMLSLYVCGKSFDEFTRDRYYLCHINIVLLYKMLLLYPLFMLVGYVLKNVKNSGHLASKNVVEGLICFVLGALCFGYIGAVIKINELSDSYVEMYDLKKNYYKTEKMLRFFYLKKERPVIPLYPVVPAYVEAEYLDKVRIDGRLEDVRCFKNHSLSASYYYRIYKDAEVFNVGFCVSENAEKYFMEKGGSFSDKELSELKFKNLFDEKFVLNNSN